MLIARDGRTALQVTEEVTPDIVVLDLGLPDLDGIDRAAHPQKSVAKPTGELHDVAGVWIADASGMPSCSGVNPMVSTMALARRTASNMLDAD